MTPAEIEYLRVLIAKLKHPMVNENGAHVGNVCAEERMNAALALQDYLALMGADDGPKG